MRKLTLVIFVSVLTASAALAQTEDAFGLWPWRVSTGRAGAETERKKVFILFDEKARHIDRVAAVRAQIDGLGGRVRAVFGVAGIVAELDRRAMRRIASTGGVHAVHDAAIKAYGDVQTQAAIAAWNRMIKPPARKPAGKPPVGAPETDVIIPPDMTRDRQGSKEREAAYR